MARHGPVSDQRMNKPQPTSPRRRLQELLAIPDHDRTDEEWDELNELEISLAPGNRVGAKDPVPFVAKRSVGGGGGPGQKRQHRPKGPGQGGGQGGGQGAGNGARFNAPPPVQNAGSGDGAEAGPAPGAPGSGEKRKKPARKFHKRGPKPNQGPGPGTPPATE